MKQFFMAGDAVTKRTDAMSASSLIGRAMIQTVTGSPKSKAAAAPLSFWAHNMVSLADSGMSWPGFSYTADEWARLRALAAPVSGAAYLKFQIWTAVIFLILACGAIATLFTLLTYIYPDTSKTPASVFIAMLALCCLVTIGLGIPATMSVASRLSAGGADLSAITPQPMDMGLARKINRQIWRVTAIMCGLFAPGALIWIVYDIQAGPIITMLKYGALAVMAASLWFARKL